MQQHPPLDLLTFAEPYLLDTDADISPPKHTLAELRWLSGRKLKFGVDVNLIESTPTKPLSTLERHLRAARLGRERRANRILVIEGDVDIDRTWRFQERGVLSHLGTLDWDIIDLGYRRLPPIPAPPTAAGSDVGSAKITVEPEPPGDEPTASDRTAGITLEGDDVADVAGDASQPAAPSLPVVRVDGDVDGGWAYLLHGFFLETWIAHLDAMIATEANEGGAKRDRVALTAGHALDTITSANPLTMRYRIEPPLMQRTMPAPGNGSGGLLLTRALFRRGSRRQGVGG